MGTWDMGVDFKEALMKLLQARSYLRAHPTETNKRLLRSVNILITQLTNGLRVSEALDCYYKFLETLEREIEVKLAKSKDKYRICMIPPFFDKLDVLLTKDVKRPHPTVLTHIARRYFGFNTHSLRYAFINYMLQQDIDVATVSKIVGHRKLDTILTYVQERRARRTLEEHLKKLFREFKGTAIST